MSIFFNFIQLFEIFRLSARQTMQLQVKLYVFVLFEGKLASYTNIVNEGSVENLKANQKRWMRISYYFIANSNFYLIY